MKPIRIVSIAIGAFLGLHATSVCANVVIVESRSGGQNVAWYSDVNGTAANWANSSAKSTAPGCTPGIGSRYNPTTNTPDTTRPPSFTVSPVLAVPGGVYKLEVTYPNGNNSSNMIVAITQTGCTGLPATTTAFQGPANNAWKLVGYLTNDPGVNTPVITFTYQSGFIAATAGRWYGDAVRFTLIDPCTDIASIIVNPTGPLAAGQTFVNVPNVDGGATNITVYADGVPIGSLTSGIVAGLNVVPTTPLVKGQQITATWAKGGCTTTRSGTGPAVGSGANTPIRVSLTLGKNSALTGPIGAPNAGTGANLYWLKATGQSGGFATAPLGGEVLYPDGCWKTVIFNNDTDNAFTFTGSPGPFPNPDPYAVLESIAFCIDNTSPDTGPFDIYIDSIMNGDTLIQGFEGYTDGTYGVTFLRPNASTTPANLLSQPDVANISQLNVDEGTNALRTTFQFRAENGTFWCRLYCGGTPSYPTVDLRKPISLRMLVLPVGQTTGTKFNGTVSAITNSGPTWVTGTNTLGVTVSGPGTYTYQWSWSGGALPNPTTGPTYTIDGFGSGVSDTDNGLYTVTVSDGSCTITRAFNFKAQPPIPVITNQPAHAVLPVGSTAAAMTVGATGHVPGGYPLSYLWRKNGVELYDQTAAALVFPSGVTAADAGLYDVIVANSYGSVTSVVATLSVVSVAPGSGTGLQGTYWTWSTNDNPFVGPPTLSRVDPVVSFNWGNGSPDASISADYFTARWYGQVQALGTDTYYFVTRSDDGVRLWINGQLLIDKWVLQAPTSWTNSIALTGNTKYNLLLEYFERAGGAVAELNWFTASGSIPYTPIPASQLYPLTFVPPTVTLTSPTDPTVVTLPATVNLSATVLTNSAVEINGVQFLTNGVLLATVATPPYTYPWADPPAGNYIVSARALYNVSSRVNSGTASLTVNQVVASPVTISAGSLVGGTLHYAGGAGARFVLVKSPNLAVPTASWTRVATNLTTPGSFVLPIGADGPVMFYRVLSE